MAVRTDQDRRMGGGAEKLLTLGEAARRLELPADDVESMIRRGELPSFRLGGSLVRVRAKDVDAVRRKKTPKRSATFWERLVDFFYFNDFYIVVLLILLTLLTIILAL